MRMFKGARQKLLGVYLPPSTEKIRKVVFDSLPKGSLQKLLSGFFSVKGGGVHSARKSLILAPQHIPDI